MALSMCSGCLRLSLQLSTSHSTPFLQGEKLNFMKEIFLSTDTLRKGRLSSSKLFSKLPTAWKSNFTISPTSIFDARTERPEKKRDASDNLPEFVSREAHKYFDQAVISVKSGDGGNGDIVKLARPTVVKGARNKKEKELQKAKKKAERGGPKRGTDGEYLVPMGGHGGDIVLYADEFTPNLLGFHNQKRFSAKRGGNVNAGEGLGRRDIDGISASQLRIPVPVGTVVKRKRGGKFLADLSCPGDEVVVARGGAGGVSVLKIPDGNRAALRPTNMPPGATVVSAPKEKELTAGLPGEDVTLELTLRVVADVGLVGLPNAGKSSLLAAVTAAKPEIASYPFTTLMPNLGRLEGDPMARNSQDAVSATLADLPGLIEGAHVGRGLGRMFLRHLRRTRVLLHLVDASAPDPLADYHCLREELWMYNEEYTERPHIVVLNKIDIPEAAERFFELKSKILSPVKDMVVENEVAKERKIISKRESKKSARHLDLGALDSLGGNVDVLPIRDGEVSEESAQRRVKAMSLPVAVVGTSAKEGLGMDDLLRVVRETLMNEDKKSAKSKQNVMKSFGKTERLESPKWQV